MKIATYMCDCCSTAHEFPESDKREKYFCPDCGHEMWYWTSSDIDDTTGLVTENYTDATRDANSPKIDIKPVPKCPTCGSTNISKIGVISRAVSISFFGLASSKIGKTHKCNSCGTTW